MNSTDRAATVASRDAGAKPTRMYLRRVAARPVELMSTSLSGTAMRSTCMYLSCLLMHKSVELLECFSRHKVCTEISSPPGLMAFHLMAPVIPHHS